MKAAHNLQSAIERVYREAQSLAGDVGGSASTAEFTDAVLRAIKR